MQTYIGVVRVQAEPEERDGVPGYRVRHEDGRAHDSWLPADVFEWTYFPFCKENALTQEDVDRFFSAGIAQACTLGDKTACVTYTAPTGVVLCDFSSHVYPECFDPVMGEMVCRDKIKLKLIELLGFVHCWAANGLGK